MNFNRLMAGRRVATSAMANIMRSQQRATMMLGSTQMKHFRQVHNLHEIVYTTQEEQDARTIKYLERTDKVYKPSQTLEFNREGEMLLWSCDNIKNS